MFKNIKLYFSIFIILLLSSFFYQVNNTYAFDVVNNPTDNQSWYNYNWLSFKAINTGWYPGNSFYHSTRENKKYLVFGFNVYGFPWVLNFRYSSWSYNWYDGQEHIDESKFSFSWSFDFWFKFPGLSSNWFSMKNLKSYSNGLYSADFIWENRNDYIIYPYISILFYFSENNWNPIFKILTLWNNKIYFIKDNILILLNWNSLEYYNIKNDLTLEYWSWNSDKTIFTPLVPLQILSIKSWFISPSIYSWSPVYITGISWKYNGWYYIGTDNKSHFLEENNIFIDNNVLDWQSLLPLWIFQTKFSNKNILFANRNPSYSSVLSYLDSSNEWNVKNWVETWSILQRITTFENPNLFFQKSDWNIVKWNLNCLTPWYTSTQLLLSDNKYYCTDWNWNKSPNNEDSNIEIVPPFDNSSSSWGTDWDFSIVWFSWWLYTYNTKPQNCNPVYFSWVTTSSSWNQSWNNPNECAFININWNFRCQDYSWNTCKSFWDLCTKEYTQETINSFSGTQNYSWDITKYNCSTSKYSCKWLDKNTCSPSDYCFTPDNVYCKVKPDKEDISIIDENNNEVSENKIKTPSISDPFNSFVWLGKWWFTWWITWSTWTWYNNIVNSVSNSWYCEMFNWASFIYYSNWPWFSFNLNLSWFTTNKYIKDYFLVWIDKFVNIIISPLNNTLNIIRTFLPISNNTNVCFFWTIQNIKYQKILNVWTDKVNFHYKINSWEMTYFDYIFLFWYWLFVLFFIIWLFWFWRLLNLHDTPNFNNTWNNIKAPITRTSRRQTYIDIYWK